MLPKKELNIYPKNPENLNALIGFYFDKYELDKEGAVDALLKQTSLSLNQIEFIVRNLSESWDSVFKNFFNSGTTVTNLMRYGIEGLTKDENNWGFGPHSKARPKIAEFIAFVKRNDE